MEGCGLHSPPPLIAAANRFDGADALENRLLWQVNSWVHRENAMAGTPVTQPGSPERCLLEKRDKEFFTALFVTSILVRSGKPYFLLKWTDTLSVGF